MLAPVGAVTVIVPVGVAHVGCVVTLAVGADGAPTTNEIVSFSAWVHAPKGDFIART